jgi:surfeit locus 1 family protein
MSAPPDQQLDRRENGSHRNSRIGTVSFALLMLALAGLFAFLGTWQLARLDQKLSLETRVAERMAAAAEALPPVGEWVGLDPDVYDYRPVSVTGTFDYAGSVLVFTSLADTQGRYEGVGYWVMTPLNLETGGTIFINRGFVPEELAATYRNGGSGPVGEVTVTGIARRSEQANAFTPGPDFGTRTEWVRNIERLAAFNPGAYVPLAGVYVDAPASEEGALPQGGETTLSFPNRHFEYALTWFSLAAITTMLLGYWLWRQRRA